MRVCVWVCARVGGVERRGTELPAPLDAECLELGDRVRSGDAGDCELLCLLKNLLPHLHAKRVAPQRHGDMLRADDGCNHTQVNICWDLLVGLELSQQEKGNKLSMRDRLRVWHLDEREG